MKTNLLVNTIHRNNNSRPPVWMMRQAGRYHSHYQNFRIKYSFVELCKNPYLASQVTMGPIQDFDFDAAILFSDLLFPLEAMGMGLKYSEGPKLDWHLKTLSDLKKLSGGRTCAENLEFQREALQLIRQKLPEEKGLLGFVGGPLTLYCYAVEGTHEGSLTSAREGLIDGRYSGFVEKISELLLENLLLQAQGNPDVIAIMDTCAGDFDSNTFREYIVPPLRELLREFKKRSDCPILYYSKGTDGRYWEHLADLPLAGIGIDWNHDLSEVLVNWGENWAIQGNIDPKWLFLDDQLLETRLRGVFQRILDLPLKYRKGWICGLGHGILPQTPEQNVRLFIRIQKEMFFGDRESWI